MNSRCYLVALIILLILSVPALAGTTTIRPAKFDTIKNQITAGNTGIVYEIQNPNIYYVHYRIADFNTSTYDYSIKLFSNNHASILEDYQLNQSNGTIQLHTKTIGSGTYWLNLMATIHGDEIAQDAYCAAHGYPCEISKNLDIIRMDIGTTESRKGDDYQNKLAGYIDRSGQPVRGAAWTAK